MDVMGPKQHNFTNISFIEGIQKEINEKIPQSMTFRQYSLLFTGYSSVCVLGIWYKEYPHQDLVFNIGDANIHILHWHGLNL